MIVNLPYELSIVCLVIGLLGAALGGWICARGYEKRFEAQRKAFELARERAERDLQRAFSCVPQWMQQTVRVEFELLGIQQMERWKELLDQQQHWQSGQESLRRLEWQALLAHLPGVRPASSIPTRSAGANRTVAPHSLAREPEPSVVAWPPPQPVDTPAPREQELTDEEIDALPPDLPPPAPPRARKLAAPKGPVLRNI